SPVLGSSAHRQSGRAHYRQHPPFPREVPRRCNRRHSDRARLEAAQALAPSPPVRHFSVRLSPGLASYGRTPQTPLGRWETTMRGGMRMHRTRWKALWIAVLPLACSPSSYVPSPALLDGGAAIVADGGAPAAPPDAGVVAPGGDGGPVGIAL